MAKKYVMHVICGTHWDREWRHTAEQSKLRLVDLMDSIIELLEQSQEYRHFCVDGGTVVLEDYLTIRPENKDRIRKLIETGKMQIVNWYTLPETNTVAPEALIRNLLLGRKMAWEFGGSMRSGYTATSYGQNSQMPQIYQGFGIDTAIFYRGTNKHILAPLYRWEGADGSKLYALRTFDEVTRTNGYFYIHQPLVLGKPCRDLTYTYDRNHDPVHLCDEGLYEKAFTLLREDSNFRRDPDSLEQAMRGILNQAMPYAIGNQLLALNMEDNDQPFPLLPEMIQALNQISPDVEIIQTTLDEYMNTIIRQSDEVNLPVHKGELRYTTVEHGSFNALLGATHSSRIKLKLLNDRVETNLLYLAEPLATLAAVYGKEYPKINLNRAWEALLKNHAHDSICGAAVDRAHEDMLYNFSIANTVAEEVAGRSVTALFRRINTAKCFNRNDHTITLFNTLGVPRQGVVPVVIDLPEKAKDSGAGSIGVDGANTGDVFCDIVDAEGRPIEYVELSSEPVKIGVERELDCKAIKFAANRRRILIHAAVPAIGYSTYALRLRKPNYIFQPQEGLDRKLIARENGVLENEHLKVIIHSNGTFSLLHKASGRIMDNLHYFTDSGETGSAHISNQPQRNPIITSLGNAAAITMIESNRLRGVYKIEMKLEIPAAATLDSRDRFRCTVELPITYWLTLEKDCPYLKIRTRLRNEARDHKLCVNFPSGVHTDMVVVESSFAVEKRPIRWTETGDNFESHIPFQPMQNFIDLNDSRCGLAFLGRGLREYEIKDDTDRTMAITLLRTHRAYMTANQEMTPEELDKYIGLQSFGDFEYQYALYPHSGDWEEGRVLPLAYQFKVDLKAIQGVSRDGELPCTHSFIRIDPADKVMISALKLAENGTDYVLRLWNTTAEQLRINLEIALPVKSAEVLRLDETPLERADIENGHIGLGLGAHKLLTLLLKCR